MRLHGWSMFPLTAPLRGAINRTAVPERGDILAFIGADGRLVFHRVVQVEADAFVTRGDTNLNVDKKVPRDAVIGVVDGVAFGDWALSWAGDESLTKAVRAIGLAWNATAPVLRRAIRRLRGTNRSGRRR